MDHITIMNKISEIIKETMSTKLYDDIIKKCYTDIELILEDQDGTITINSHKIVLVSASDYFSKLFSFGGKCRSSIKIRVPNAKIARDMVLSFYGAPGISSKDFADWQYILEMFRCRNFFCIENDVSLIYDIQVPSEGFDLLLEIVDLFDFIHDKRLNYTVKKNIPINYDLSNLSIEFVAKLSASQKYFIISVHTNYCIKIWNIYASKPLKKLYGHTNWVRIVKISNDNLLMASGSDDGCIKLWDLRTYKLLNTLSSSNWILCMAFSHTNLKIVSGCDGKEINIWNIGAGQLERIICNDCPVISIAFSSNDLRILSVDSRAPIKIWNSETGLILKMITASIFTHDAIFSSDDLRIISSDKYGNIQIWDTESEQLLDSMYSGTNKTNYVYTGSIIMALSPDNLKIVISCGYSIKIWDIKSYKLLNELQVDYFVVCLTFSSNGLEIVFSDDTCGIKIWDIVSGNLTEIFCESESKNDSILNLACVKFSDMIDIQIQEHMKNWI